MEFIPLIAVLTVFIGGCIWYGVWEVRRVREHPELGPVGDDRYWWEDSLRPRGNVDRGEPPISNDPGGF